MNLIRGDECHARDDGGVSGKLLIKRRWAYERRGKSSNYRRGESPLGADAVTERRGYADYGICAGWVFLARGTHLNAS